MSGRLVDGRYRLDQVLGRGGMATVWRGVDVRLDRPVAVKVLDESALTNDPTAGERFDREARTVARLTHPNVVAVYDTGRDGETAYLVMELVDGHSLAARLAGGPLDVGEVITIAVHVCDALSAAHQAGVVHRDIKPENILLGRTGAVKVCDFGIARLLHTATAQANLTGPATAIGTSNYMAPEHVAGDPVDARADLYALGCVLYAMLTGDPPFIGDSPLGVVSQHLHRPPPSVRSRRADVPAELDTLITDLLAKSPADRPADAGQVRDRLTAIDPPSGGPAATASGAATPARWPSGRAAVVAATRPLPTADAPGLTRPTDLAPSRPRTGALAAIVAAVVAVVFVVAIVAALIDDRSTGQGADPSVSASSAPAAPTTGPPTTAPPPPAARDSAAALAAVSAAVRQQEQAGQLDRDAGKEMTKKLDQISRDVAKGEIGKAAEKVAELRKKLTELHKDNKLTSAGLNALIPLLDRLAGTLPAGQRDDD
jgi:serine/threonine-protein kinase